MSSDVTQTEAWECFQDSSYYDMWCVRQVGDRTFGSGFHLMRGEEAIALRDLLNQRADAQVEPVAAQDVAALVSALEAIAAEAERENGSWVHLKRCIAVQARAALGGEHDK